MKDESGLTGTMSPRWVLPVCIVAALLSAGCSGPNVGAPGVPLPVVPTGPGCDPMRPALVHGPATDAAVAVPCLVATGGRSGEPTLGVCPKTGTVFAYPSTTPADSQAGRGVAKSADQGKTWTHVVPNVAGAGTHRTSLDPYFYLDPATCRIFVDDWYASCTGISFSDDEGATWTNSASNCGQFDHQTIFAGPPVTSHPVGYADLVYQCAINLVFLVEASVASTCQKSLDGGVTWIPTGEPSYVTDPAMAGRFGVPAYCDGGHGHGFVDRHGTVYLPKGLCGEPFLAISHDEGATWTRVQVSNLGMPIMSSKEGAYFEHEASVGVDGDGVVYYGWVANDRMPYLAISRDGGLRWERPLPLAPSGLKEAALLQMAVGAPGHVVAAYYGTMNSPGHFPTTSACNPDPARCAQDLAGSEPEPPQVPGYERTTWDAMLVETANALDARPVLLTGTVNDPRDPIVRGTCGPIRCQGAGDFIDVRIGPDGTPWAAFVDLCTGDCSTGKQMTDNANDGIVGRLVGGPNLLGDLKVP